MRFTKIKETCLYSKDLATAYDFYVRQLGLEEVHYKAGEHLFVRAGASMLLIFDPDASRRQSSPPPHYGSGQLHFAFEVPWDDYEAAKATIRGLGIAIEDEQSWPAGGRSFYFRDPEGHCLEIVQPGIWGD